MLFSSSLYHSNQFHPEGNQSEGQHSMTKNVPDIFDALLF